MLQFPCNELAQLQVYILHSQWIFQAFCNCKHHFRRSLSLLAQNFASSRLQILSLPSQLCGSNSRKYAGRLTSHMKQNFLMISALKCKIPAGHIQSAVPKWLVWCQFHLKMITSHNIYLYLPDAPSNTDVACQDLQNVLQAKST